MQDHLIGKISAQLSPRCPVLKKAVGIIVEFCKISDAMYKTYLVYQSCKEPKYEGPDQGTELCVEQP